MDAPDPDLTLKQFNPLDLLYWQYQSPACHYYSSQNRKLSRAVELLSTISLFHLRTRSFEVLEEMTKAVEVFQYKAALPYSCYRSF